VCTLHRVFGAFVYISPEMHGTWNSLQQCVYGEASSDKIHTTLQKHGPEETNPT